MSRLKHCMKDVPVTVRRTLDCFDCANVFVIDRSSDGRGAGMLLWDTDIDAMAVGYGFVDYVDGGDTMAFERVVSYEDKRAAMRKWLSEFGGSCDE